MDREEKLVQQDRLSFSLEEYSYSLKKYMDALLGHGNNSQMELDAKWNQVLIKWGEVKSARLDYLGLE